MSNSNASVFLKHQIFCRRSGLLIGQMEFLTTAGTLPYLAGWSETVCYHPVFSMDRAKLIKFARDEWQRLAQRAMDSEVTEAESNILRVTYLAMLHSLESIKQEEPALPPLKTVQSTIESLFNLAGWKYFLESKRFRFPVLHVARRNGNIQFDNIAEYLDLCFEVKHAYENRVSESVEKAKLEAAERAMAALRSEWVQPVGKKMLFQWIRAHLESKYQADAEGWLGTLFLGSDKTVLEFEQEDIQLFEEIIVSQCPVGSSIFKAVRERIAHVRQAWEAHFAAWEVELDDDQFADPKMQLLINGMKQEAKHPGSEPKQEGFDTRGKFLQAQARWTIAMAQWKKENEL